MAKCYCTFWSAFCAWATFSLYVAAYVVDWWALSSDNRADLDGYSLASPDGGALVYAWDEICVDADCDKCDKGDTTCDDRTAGTKCGDYAPITWCDQMTEDDCVELFEWECNSSAPELFQDEANAGCGNVTKTGSACSEVANCRELLKVAVGFGAVSSVFGLLVWCITCWPKKSFVGGLVALIEVGVLVVEFGIGVGAMSSGFTWTAELPDTPNKPGLWLCVAAVAFNFLAALVFGCTAALNCKCISCSCPKRKKKERRSSSSEDTKPKTRKRKDTETSDEEAGSSEEASSDDETNNDAATSPKSSERPKDEDASAPAASSGSTSEAEEEETEVSEAAQNSNNGSPW